MTHRITNIPCGAVVAAWALDNRVVVDVASGGEFYRLRFAIADALVEINSASRKRSDIARREIDKVHAMLVRGVRVESLRQKKERLLALVLRTDDPLVALGKKFGVEAVDTVLADARRRSTWWAKLARKVDGT